MAEQQERSLLDEILALGKHHVVDPLVGQAKSDIREIKEKGVPHALARGLYNLPLTIENSLGGVLGMPQNTGFGLLEHPTISGLLFGFPPEPERQPPTAPPGPAMGDWQRMAALGMASPQAGMPPGSIEAMMGYRGQQQQGLGAPFLSAPWPEMPQQPQFQAPAAPDFTAVREALGPAPEKPEEVSRGEQLARVLGGASAGALRGMRGGGDTGAILAGAGGGAGAVTGQLRQEEEARQKDYRDAYERHKTNLARIETAATQAKSMHDRYVANMEWQQESMRWSAERQDHMARRPKVHVNSAGIATVQVVEDGEFKSYVVDTQAELKMAIAQLKGQKEGGTIWLGEPTEAKYLNEDQIKMAEASLAYITSGRILDGDFRDMLDSVIDEHFKGIDVDELLAMYASTHIDAKQLLARLQLPIMMTAGRLGELRMIQEQGAEAVYGTSQGQAR